MSDETIRSSPAQAPTPSGIWEHYCEHPDCSAWGAYGYQIGKQTAHWYCREHRAAGERLIGRG